MSILESFCGLEMCADIKDYLHVNKPFALKTVVSRKFISLSGI